MKHLPGAILRGTIQNLLSCSHIEQYLRSCLFHFDGNDALHCSPLHQKLHRLPNGELQFLLKVTSHTIYVRYLIYSLHSFSFINSVILLRADMNTQTVGIQINIYVQCQPPHVVYAVVNAVNFTSSSYIISRIQCLIVY